MSTTKQEPWIVGTEDDSDFFLVGPETHPGLVTAPILRTHDERLANLVSAAPELLKALEWCVGHGWVQYTQRLKQNAVFCDGVDSVHAAIAKARGKST
jgi:hypothetical protein